MWGGYRDSNPGPPGPQPGALANWATPTMFPRAPKRLIIIAANALPRKGESHLFLKFGMKNRRPARNRTAATCLCKITPGVILRVEGGVHRDGAGDGRTDHGVVAHADEAHYVKLPLGIFYALRAAFTATAQATVAPTMGLLPMPMRPIMSTCAGTEEEPANWASECMRPMVSVMP